MARPKKTDIELRSAQKTHILFHRLDFVLNQTAISMNMTLGEINNAIMWLMDSVNDNLSKTKVNGDKK